MQAAVSAVLQRPPPDADVDALVAYLRLLTDVQRLTASLEGELGSLLGSGGAGAMAEAWGEFRPLFLCGIMHQRADCYSIT